MNPIWSQLNQSTHSHPLTQGLILILYSHICLVHSYDLFCKCSDGCYILRTHHTVFDYHYSNRWTLHNEGVSKSFRTGRLERELQMVQVLATRCSHIAIFWVRLVSFVAIALCVASQRVFIFAISLSTQSGNFWIHSRTSLCNFLHPSITSSLLNKKFPP
jgi:hypothetical protein